MNKESDKKLSQLIQIREMQKIKERRRSKHAVLKGIGLFGLIGWSVVVPTLLGTYVGIWIDRTYPSVHSWTLTLLLTGLIVGCAGAWYWLSREKKDIQKMGQDNGGNLPAMDNELTDKERDNA